MTDKEQKIQNEMQFVAYQMAELSKKIIPYSDQHAIELQGASEILIEWSNEFFKQDEQ